jgi:hypothetical protein
MFCFILEIVLASWAKDDYFLGFYFWLDVVASASLIFDIGWLYDAMLGQQQLTASNAKQTNTLARATKGARIGTKAGRIARVIRLIRLIRIVKLYKSANSVLEREEAKYLEENQIQPLTAGPGEAHDNGKTDGSGITKHGRPSDALAAKMAPEESKVGKKLSDLTTRRVIILVLAMLFSVPLFSTSTYLDPFNSYTFGLQMLAQYDTGSEGFNEVFKYYI